MGELSDAFKTCENIYELINRAKHSNASRMKQTLINFFNSLQGIFWEGNYYLFHAYALMNLQSITKSNRNIPESDKAKTTINFLLSVFSVPLHNRISHLEKLSTQYLPQGMPNEDSATAKKELFTIAKMLQVKGLPSRQSLINHIRIKNIHLSSGTVELQ